MYQQEHSQEEAPEGKSKKRPSKACGSPRERANSPERIQGQETERVRQSSKTERKTKREKEIADERVQKKSKGKKDTN